MPNKGRGTLVGQGKQNKLQDSLLKEALEKKFGLRPEKCRL
mgnify:CR=1 FL=1